MSSLPPDTIVAIATPPGRGGIGVVRLSGPDAIAVAGRLVRLAGSLARPLGREDHARARRGGVLDPAGEDSAGSEIPSGRILDECLITAFFAPHSYTGEDVVEIAAHGSPLILNTVVRAALAAGRQETGRVPLTGPVPLTGSVRLAGPGEFTQRAFLAGRLDLTQAEAVQDLIAAQTLDQARVAAQQLGGALARRVAPAKETLLHLIALLEAGMDFASGELDDVDVVPPAQIALSIESVVAPLQALAATFQRGQLLRNGAAIALIGRPNAGKSSLFNRLLERDRAIVTATPGTTRDTLEESLSLGGIPLRLVDTAGLRGPGGSGDEAQSEIAEAEALGIARTQEALADADLVLHVIDLSAEPDARPLDLTGRAHIVIHNKVDLTTGRPSRPDTQENYHPDPELFEGEGPAPRSASLLPSSSRLGPRSPVRTSALTGEGIDDLRAAILAKLDAGGPLAEAGLNNLRQQQAVDDTLRALAAAAAANIDGLPHEVVLMDLHAGLRALDSLTGATTAEDILARIFSTFCIGK